MRPDWNPQISLGGLISHLSFKLRKRAEAALTDSGLGHISFARFWTLHELHESPKNQAALCEKLNQRAPSMMEMLNRLKSDGLVTAKASASDPRRKLWSLSAAGKRDYLRAREALRDVGRDIDDFFRKNGVKSQEVERIKEVLALLSHTHLSGY